MVKEFTTKASKKKQDALRVVEFTVDGEKYEFTQPNETLIALAAAEAQAAYTSGNPLPGIKAVVDFFKAGLPADQWNRLEFRMKDPKDRFDMRRLMDILEWVFEELTDRPTK